MSDFVLADAADAPGRRERERLARRRAMLDAALVTFGEHGFDGATVDEIAERAEFGKGTLYNYFPGGKDELYMTLFETDVIGGLIEVVARAFPAGADLSTPAAVRTRFCDFIEALLDHFARHRSQFLLYMKEGQGPLAQPERMAFFAGHFDRVIDAVTGPIETAMAAGALRRLPARSVAHLLLGNIRGHLMGRDACERLPEATPFPFETAGESASFITTVLFDGLLADPA